MSFPKNPLQPFIEMVPKPLRNRYTFSLCLFFLWMVFFDKHDLYTQFSLQQSINKIEEDKTFYQEKIQEIYQEKASLDKNAEKHAREKYFMSKNNEDVFIIETEKD